MTDIIRDNGQAMAQGDRGDLEVGLKPWPAFSFEFGFELSVDPGALVVEGKDRQARENLVLEETEQTSPAFHSENPIIDLSRIHGACVLGVPRRSGEPGHQGFRPPFFCDMAEDVRVEEVHQRAGFRALDFRLAE